MKKHSFIYSEYQDLGKLNLVVWFLLKQIFDTIPAASKNDAYYKSSQKWLENNQISLLVTHFV